MECERLDFDIVIVGAGPAGLSCAIKLKQLSPEISVCILEKGAEIGAHSFSGAVMDTRSLDELIPLWRVKNSPVKLHAVNENFKYLTKKYALPLFAPPEMSNRGNYIISQGAVVRWLAEYAEEAGVEIFPGFAASEVIYDDEGAVAGVATGGADDIPQVQVRARQTIFAEGCHGFLSRQVIERFKLTKNCDPQTYGLGLKELWEVPDENHVPGKIFHTLGHPLPWNTYGGGFIYHMNNNLISIGFVVGLDYSNPYLSPYGEFQRFKLHPMIRKMLNGGKRIGYGAKTLVEGGFQSVPELIFPGGLLIGDSAGFLNILKIKGIHMAMKSGILAAESLSTFLKNTEKATECFSYPEKLKTSWLWEELRKVRNIRPAFKAGLPIGLANAGFEAFTGGIAPWTFHIKQNDHECLKEIDKSFPIDYGEPDNIFTFDRTSSVYLSGTSHEEGQACHLKLEDSKIPIEKNLPLYGEPSQRYCPARVYEIIMSKSGESEFRINSQNCLHCMACTIKDPLQNIKWTLPEKGGGPNYRNM